MFEAKVAMITWPFASPITRSIVSSTTRSDGVLPSISTRTVSEKSASTPSSPSRRSRRSSVGPPITGVGSNLKSAVSTIVPTGEWTAIALVSGIEWVTWMNSAVSRPSWTRCPGSTRRAGRPACSSRCSLQLALDEAERQRRAVDRDRRPALELRHDVGQAADMVLVPVRDQDRPQIAAGAP